MNDELNTSGWVIKRLTYNEFNDFKVSNFYCMRKLGLKNPNWKEFEGICLRDNKQITYKKKINNFFNFQKNVSKEAETLIQFSSSFFIF